MDLELLRVAAEQGIIDLSLIAEELQMRKDAEYLNQHNYSIWEAPDGRWCTYLPTEGKRTIIRKKDQKQLNKEIVKFYKENDPDTKPSFKQEFDAWIKSKEEYKEAKVRVRVADTPKMDHYDHEFDSSA